MKKNLLLVFSLVTLVACGNNTSTSNTSTSSNVPSNNSSESISSSTVSSSTHTHTYSDEWSKDADGHWHESTCGHEATAKEAHTWNEGEKTKLATCTEEGEITYTCTVCEFEKVEKYDVLGHSYGEVTYTWAEDNSTVTASRTCANDAEHVETETVNTVAEVTQAQTCENNELTTYTATFENDAFETQVKENVVTKEALNHAYGEVTYTWSEDNSTVTASRTCANNVEHVETETVNTTAVVTQTLTCTANELTTYTATFENKAFETQVKENVVTKEAEGHKYVDGYCSCNAKDPNHYFVMSIPEALAAEDGEKVEVSGVVSIINIEWHEYYKNISVTIVDEEGNSLYIFRLATKVELGDIITVKGEMTTYDGLKEINAGATAVITGHTLINGGQLEDFEDDNKGNHENFGDLL